MTSSGWGCKPCNISGHKIGAPKGIGILYVDRRVPCEPLIHGGGQEGGRRSGTENVAAAVGMSVALRLAGGQNDDATGRRDRFIAHVLDGVPHARLTGDAAHRLPGSASFVFRGPAGSRSCSTSRLAASSARAGRRAPPAVTSRPTS
ncbi:aminotransferase class V-fold PLP-dependent enzyme [Aeromicrobium sp. UC242_57]|uniref:aminotransferase class V-fold PLP-dependent enzyme n=1 Tax=Aeromicrobium sp. UC242_57 TaxID=3374624 RepID=UPI00379A8200